MQPCEISCIVQVL